jgi:hypothetical protein
LIEASSTIEVQTAIADEASFLERLATKSQKSLASACHAAVNRHLRSYLEDYWCRNNLWQSWSNYGHSEAAHRMRCDFNEVLRTTG